MAIYMKVDYVKGNVTAKGHEGWIELHHLNMDISRHMSTKVGKTQDREHSVPTFSDVEISKSLDTASNDLLQLTLKGETIPSIEVHLCTTGKSLEPYAKYIFEDVMISQASNIIASGTIPEETWRLNFTKMTVSYIGRDNTHDVATQNVVGYNLETAQMS